MRNLLYLFTILLLLSQTAFAQVNPFRWATLGIQDEDVGLLTEAARSLYVGREPVKNTRATWQNPNTGNSGIAKIAGVQTSPRHCIVVAHQIKVKGKSDPQVYAFKRCKTAAGDWELTM